MPKLKSNRGAAKRFVQPPMVELNVAARIVIT